MPTRQSPYVSMPVFISVALSVIGQVKRSWTSDLASLVPPSGVPIRVEIADTPAARSKGLSGRTTLAADGLLLRWPEAGRRPIWMADMRFPLDVVWLGVDGQVLAVREAVSPCAAEPCPLFDPPEASAATAVLELHSGRAQEHGLVSGSVVAGLHP